MSNTALNHTMSQGANRHETAMGLPFFFLSFFLVFVYFEPSIWLPFVADLRISFVIAAITFVFTILYGGRVPRAPQNKLFAILLAMGVISTLFALSVDLSVEYLTLLVKVVTLYFLIVMVISSSPEYIKKLFHVVLSYGAITSIFTLGLSKLGIYQPGYKNTYRLVSYFGGIGDGTNEFGTLMVALLPLPIVMMEGEKSTAKKALYMIIALSFMLCITRTRSRGAFLGLLVVLFFILIENRNKIRMFILIAIIAGFTFTYTHRSYWSRITTMESVETIESEGSAYSRLIQYRHALDLIKLRPITGVGLRNFITAKVKLLGLDPESKITTHVTHNSYLEIGAETGVIGLAAFVLLICGTIITSYSNERYFKAQEDLRVFYKISKSIRIGLLGYAVCIFFLSEQYNSILYQWIAFAVALKGFKDRRMGLAAGNQGRASA